MVRVLVMLTACAAGVPFCAWAEDAPDGLIRGGNGCLFPIGCYELPEDEAGLKAMVDAGINLFRCRSKADLDRLAALGVYGIMPLPFQQGPTDELRQRVADVADHPALAVWEGPDEVVWNFTAYSGLHRKLGVHKTSGEWWRQTLEAVAYAEEQAAVIIPAMGETVAMIHDTEQTRRPVWINEALKSDTAYVRQYLAYVDITGCDTYPVKKDRADIVSVGAAVERWKQVGRGKPVYMVLQAFSWDELGDYYGAKETAYPTFAESRFMAYTSILHGAKGILYWGSHYLKSDAMRASIYALCSELAALQPFLVAPEVPGTALEVVDLFEHGDTPDVLYSVRQTGDDWLVLLVNEDDEERMGVVVQGLEAIEGCTLHTLYEDGTTGVRNGELIVRMQPLEVAALCTSRTYESPRTEGRDFED